jgi:hypothetical protein
VAGRVPRSALGRGYARSRLLPSGRLGFRDLLPAKDQYLPQIEHRHEADHGAEKRRDEIRRERSHQHASNGQENDEEEIRGRREEHPTAGHRAPEVPALSHEVNVRLATEHEDEKGEGLQGGELEMGDALPDEERGT